MSLIKLCGLKRIADIEAVNLLLPDYIGFVFASKSKRYVTKEEAAKLKNRLNNHILAVGVFVDEEIEKVAALLNEDVIDLAQLHGSEDENYIQHLRELTDKKIIQAFKITAKDDLVKAEASSADYILLDSGKGSGQTFNWQLIQHMKRPYFLAGGLNPDNITTAITQCQPYAVDVSSGIETGGFKDFEKMIDFVAKVRNQ